MGLLSPTPKVRDTRIFSNMDNYSIFLINEKKKVQDEENVRSFLHGKVIPQNGQYGYLTLE